MKRYIPYMSLPWKLYGRSSWCKKLQLYLKNYNFGKYVKFGAISRKFDILSITSQLKFQSKNPFAYTIGRGVNREVRNFKLAMVRECSTWPLLNRYALWKNVEVGLQTPPSPQTPYIAGLWERPKIENLNFVFGMVKMHSQQPKRNYYNV